MKRTITIFILASILTIFIPSVHKPIPNHESTLQSIAKPFSAPVSAVSMTVKEQATLEHENAPAPPETPKPAPSITVTGCGDNQYANYIYMHESGCRLDAINPIGACGIGQSLPCLKLSSVCPNWRNDYACQNRFFSSYVSRYGGWEGAYNFWLGNQWY
jgi:hypothetical protein